MKRKYLTLFLIMILFLPHLFSCNKTNEAVQPPFPLYPPYQHMKKYIRRIFITPILLFTHSLHQLMTM